jgi:hypothetical protein
MGARRRIVLSTATTLSNAKKAPLAEPGGVDPRFGVSVPLLGMTEDAAKRQIGYGTTRLRAWVEYVAPEQAEQWLAGSSTSNRKERRRHIDKMARDMCQLRGFKFTGVPIIFDPEGDIIDGHHRLRACIKAGRPFLCLIVWGVERAQVPKPDPAVIDRIASMKRARGK